MPERIIGIDPGSLRCGYGVIDWQGGRIRLVEHGVIRVQGSGQALPKRLRCIFEQLSAIVGRLGPDEAAVESVFYARNAQSLAKLAQARGVALLALELAGVPVVEYAPRAIKQAVTGRGHATKEQVRYMVSTLLGLQLSPRMYDSSDALAAALCHAFRRLQLPMRPVPKSWKAFLERFPERVLNP